MDDKKGSVWRINRHAITVLTFMIVSFFALTHHSSTHAEQSHTVDEAEQVQSNQMDSAESIDTEIEDSTSMSDEEESMVGKKSEEQASSKNDIEDTVDDAEIISEEETPLQSDDTSEASTQSVDALETPISPTQVSPIDEMLLFGSSSLTVARQTSQQERLTLTYTGNDLKNQNLGTTNYIVFNLPQGLMAAIAKTSLSARFAIPETGSGRIRTGDFSPNDIIIDRSRHQILLRTSLQRGVPGNHVYTLTITLAALPAPANGQYAFSAAGLASDQINLAVVPNTQKGTATLNLTVPTLAFYNVPTTLAFTYTQIRPEMITIPRQNPSWALEVLDTRGSGRTFQVLAKADTPLTSSSGNHRLPDDTFVFVDNNGASHSLFNGPVEVYRGQTGTNPLTSISWGANRGPLIKVNAWNVYPTAYSTTITWTLVDGPQ